MQSQLVLYRSFEASWTEKEHEGILATRRSEAETSRGAHGIPGVVAARKEHEGILATEKSEAETSRGAHGILELKKLSTHLEACKHTCSEGDFFQKLPQTRSGAVQAAHATLT